MIDFYRVCLNSITPFYISIEEEEEEEGCKSGSAAMTTPPSSTSSISLALQLSDSLLFFGQRVIKP